MRIKESSMQLESSGFQQSTKIEATSLNVVIQESTVAEEMEKQKLLQMDALDISLEGSNQSFSGYHFLSTEEIQKAEELKALDEEFVTEEDKLKIQLIEEFMSRVLKREYKIKLFTLHLDSSENDKVHERLRRLNQHNKKRELIDSKGQESKDKASRPRIRGDMAVRKVDFRYEHYEEEMKSQQLDFSAKGKVVLDNGKEIEVDYQLHLSEQSHTQFHEVLQGESILIDPIVINYGGAVTNLTKEKYAFDIDLDGKEDQISFATKGAGFLALDKNENGIIDDGSELFGPSTNNGFGELAEYDEDGNGWIDENDSVFNQLRIWERDEDGNSKLMSLGEVGIGALYLKDVTTLFDLSDEELNMQAKMKTSSIYLNEDGTAGSIHEIDLVV